MGGHIEAPTLFEITPFPQQFIDEFNQTYFTQWFDEKVYKMNETKEFLVKVSCFYLEKWLIYCSRGEKGHFGEEVVLDL